MDCSVLLLQILYLENEMKTNIIARYYCMSRDMLTMLGTELTMVKRRITDASWRRVTFILFSRINGRIPRGWLFAYRSRVFLMGWGGRGGGVGMWGGGGEAGRGVRGGQGGGGEGGCALLVAFPR